MSAVVIGGCLPTPPSVNSDEFWTYVGGNTGNLLFMYAASQIVGLPTVTLPPGVDLNRDPIASEAVETALVVIKPSANLLRPACVYENSSELQACTRWSRDLADLLVRGRVPLLLTSLGLEANPLTCELHVEQLDLLAALHGNCGLIPLRGEDTACLLRRHAVEGGVVLGCPSFTVPKAGIAALAARNERTEVAVCLPPHFQGFAAEHCTLATTLRRLVQEAGAPVLAQTQEDVAVAASWGGRALLFSNVDDWCAELKNYGAVLSGRIHGSVAALMAAVPCITFCTSTRVRELSDVLALPAWDVTDPRLESLCSPDNLLNLARSVWADAAPRIDAKRATLAQRWCVELARLCLPPSHHLQSVADSAPPPVARDHHHHLLLPPSPLTAFGVRARHLRIRRLRNQLPQGFLCADYALCNPDLLSDDIEALSEHFLQSGQKEGRPWRLAALPCDFTPNVYRLLNPDLANLNDDQCAVHYRAHGKREGRLWQH